MTFLPEKLNIGGVSFSMRPPDSKRFFHEGNIIWP